MKMTYWDKKLIREQLDKKLKPFKSAIDAIVLPSSGWIKTMREALGMTTYDLAKIAEVDQARVFRIEKAEIEGNVKLNTMEKMANALNMKFVYGLVPMQDLEGMVREQALKIAKERMQRLSQTMGLEDQGLTVLEKEKALGDMVDRILIDEPRDFWSR